MFSDGLSSSSGIAVPAVLKACVWICLQPARKRIVPIGRRASLL
jgi:hypothetical protein